MTKSIFTFPIYRVYEGAQTSGAGTQENLTCQTDANQFRQQQQLSQYRQHQCEWQLWSAFWISFTPQLSERRRTTEREQLQLAKRGKRENPTSISTPNSNSNSIAICNFIFNFLCHCRNYHMFIFYNLFELDL